jgi:transposase-like protein
VKVRAGGRIVSRAVMIAVAVNGEACSATGPRNMPDGKREVPGVATGLSGAETFRTEFLRSLADRGLRGVTRVIADDHKGLRAAARRVFNATHRRCRIRGMRNALARAPARQRTAVAAMLTTILARETRAEAQWEVVADALREKRPKPGALMEASRGDVRASISFPRERRTQIARTNPLERVNREVKRRAEVIGPRAFLRTGGSHALDPDDEAIVRLLGAFAIMPEPVAHNGSPPGANDGRAVARRHMPLETLGRVTENPTVSLPAVAA